MGLTHVDPESNLPRMVDVGDKELTKRSATARSIVSLPEIVRKQFEGGDIRTRKGPVFQTAIIAGTMAVKRTHELIPFCHPIGIEKCTIDIVLNPEGDVVIECSVGLSSRTGVEMEALTGSSVAALTVYDMCKALSQEIVIRETRLISKTGGKTDYRYNG
jgi:cyclic pyranopterin phosphate synthase